MCHNLHQIRYYPYGRTNWLQSNMGTSRHFHQILDQGLVGWPEGPEGFWTSSLDGVRLFDKVAAVRVLTV